MTIKWYWQFPILALPEIWMCWPCYFVHFTFVLCISHISEMPLLISFLLGSHLEFLVATGLLETSMPFDWQLWYKCYCETIVSCCLSTIDHNNLLQGYGWDRSLCISQMEAGGSYIPVGHWGLVYMDCRLIVTASFMIYPGFDDSSVNLHLLSVPPGFSAVLLAFV